MHKKIIYLVLIFVSATARIFSQEHENVDVPLALFYYFDSELEKIDKEIAVLEEDYKETLSLALLNTIKQKKLKKEVLNIYGSKAVKRSVINLKNFAYFSAAESFLSKQKELEEKYDIKINISADEQTLEEIKGLGTKVLKTFTKNESSANNRRIDISFHAYLSNYSVGYKISLSEALSAELSSKPPFDEKTYDLSSASSNELATTKFISELENYLSVLRVKLDTKNIFELWKLRNTGDSSITFMTPAGKPFTLLLAKLSKVAFSFNDEDAQTDKYDFYADGSLQSFTYNAINYIRCRTENHKEQFRGYYAEGSSCHTALLDTLSKKHLQQNNVVVVYACVVNGQLIFKASKVQVASQLTWPSNNHDGSGTYLQNLPLQFNSRGGDTLTLSAAALTSTYSADSRKFLEALNICDRDYIPSAITVANIITACPKIISQCYGLERLISDFDLTKHLLSASNNVTAPDRSPLQQYQDKVVMLLNRVKELQAYANNTLNTDNQTRNYTTAVQVAGYINEAANICALHFLSNAERLRLLKVLLTGNTTGGQAAIVSLFKTINLENSDANTLAFFNALISPSNNLSNGKCLISEIYSKLTFDDYKEFNKTLCYKFTAKEGVINSAFPKTESELFNATLYFDDSDFGSLPPIGTHKYDIDLLNNGDVSVSKHYVSEHRWATIQGQEGSTTKLVPIWSSSTATLNPFTLITINNRSSLSSLADINSEGIISGPAIFLKFANDKKFNDDALQAAALITDALTIATGPGLIVKAYRVGKITLALYEGAQVVGSLANIAVNGLDANDPLKKWVDQFNLIVVGWGIGKGSSKLLTLDYRTLAKQGFEGLDANTLQNVIRQYELIKDKLTLYLKNASLTKQVDQTIEYLRRMVRSELNYLSLTLKLEKSIYKELKIKFNSLDEINKNKFILDFSKASDHTLSSLNSDLELVDVWTKWNKEGITKIDALIAFKKVWKKQVRGVSFDSFYDKTSYQIKKASDKIFASELFEAWENGYSSRNSSGMQEIFKKFGLNPATEYPPCEGVWGITSVSKPSKNDMFDRFQYGGNVGGSYASPIPEESIYTIQSRALLENYFDPSDYGLKYGDYHYIKFKIVDNSGLIFEYGEAVPWFGKIGGAIQIKSFEKFNTLLNNNKIEIVSRYKFNLSDSSWSQLE